MKLHLFDLAIYSVLAGLYLSIAETSLSHLVYLIFSRGWGYQKHQKHLVRKLTDKNADLSSFMIEISKQQLKRILIYFFDPIFSPDIKHGLQK